MQPANRGKYSTFTLQNTQVTANIYRADQDFRQNISVVERKWCLTKNKDIVLKCYMSKSESNQYEQNSSKYR